MASIQESLKQISALDGFIAAALVDSSSGMTMGQINANGIDLDTAAAGSSDVVRSKRRMMSQLGMDDDIEDILITLGNQYHVIRPASHSDMDVFFYVVLDRERANLALARVKVLQAEKSAEF
ncbi:hypothetical protein IT575_00125 [bacterium]|nr:hypothetical protein [bacterium]